MPRQFVRRRDGEESDGAGFEPEQAAATHWLHAVPLAIADRKRIVLVLHIIQAPSLLT